MVKPILILQIAAMGILFFACSHGSTNISTPLTPDNESTFPIFENNANSENHVLLGTWDLEFNLDNLTAQITPNRIIEAHYNVTSLVPSPEITINSYDPVTNVVDVDVTLMNPHSVDVYDVRLIIYTDETGHMLNNSDNWTALFDIPGGQPVNPFKAYAKAVPKRKFSHQTYHVEKLLVYLPNGNARVTFAIEASFPGNCNEPYKIHGFRHGRLYDAAGEISFAEISVYDWQDNVNSVNLYCPEIFGDEIIIFDLEYTEYTWKWRATIKNNQGAEQGEYIGWLFARSTDSGNIALYKPVIINVYKNSVDFQWARTWGGEFDDRGMAVTTDNFGNVYAFGNFTAVVDFNPESGVDEHSSNGCEDMFLSKFDSNGNFIWARTWGGEGNDNSIDTREDYPYPQRGIITDLNSNIYLIGNFSSSVDFDPGYEIDIHSALGDTDVFLSKFDMSGNFKWVKTWGGNYYHSAPDEPQVSDNGHDLSFDDSGFLYATGIVFRDDDGIIDFDPGPAEDNHLSKGAIDVFLSKFDMDGNFIRALTFGGIGGDGYCLDVGNDSNNSILIVGKFCGTVDFNPWESPDDIDYHTASGFRDAFLSKYTSDCSYLWTDTWGGEGYTQCDALAVVADSNRNIYVGGGYYEGPIDFNPGEGVDLHTSNGCFDPYISKFDANGQFWWVRTWGSVDQDRVVGLDNDDKHIYIALRYDSRDLTDFDPSPNYDFHLGHDSAASILDLDGNFTWARTWGEYNNQGILEDSHDISIDNSGNIYIVGDFMGADDFDPGPNNIEYSSNGGYDVYLISFSKLAY